MASSHGGAAQRNRLPGTSANSRVYPTYFRKFEFSFSAIQTTATYDSASDPGGLRLWAWKSSTLVFDIGMSLPPEYQLHFDLYNSEIRRSAAEDHSRA